jgi:hypothetical protein
MSDQQSEQNGRQYARMLAAIPETWNLESLGSTIAALDALVELIEGADAVWKSAFRRQWGIMEEVNAFVLDEGRTTLTFEEEQIVDKAAEELRSMIRSIVGHQVTEAD